MEEKEIFILGAGFSQAIVGNSMPLLHELTKEIAEGISSSSDQDIKNIWQQYIVQPNIGNICSINEQAHNKNQSNFEDIMTFLSSDFAYEDYKDQHLKAILYRYITETIVNIFEEKNIQKEIPDTNFLSSFAKYIHTNKSKIFTFNYDLVLENLLLKINPKADNFSPLYSIKKIPVYTEGNILWGKEHFYWENTLKIYKLHGSINWLYDPEIQDGIQIRFNNAIPSKIGLQPLIVPPTMLKNFAFNTKLLKSQWYTFRENLQNATRIFILGYSIPQTDLATYYLLKTCLQDNCEIYIVSKEPKNNQKEEWKELFSAQNEQKILHVFEDGFNEESAKTIGLI